MSDNDERKDPDFQRESVFHDDTKTIFDLESDNQTLREELAICQKIVEFMRVELSDIRLENAVLRAVFDKSPSD